MEKNIYAIRYPGKETRVAIIEAASPGHAIAFSGAPEDSTVTQINSATAERFLTPGLQIEVEDLR